MAEMRATAARLRWLSPKAARRLLTRLLKMQGLPPKRMIYRPTVLLRGARRQVMPNVEHRSHKGLNNPAENSHLPFRKRERTLVSGRQALQHFVSIFSAPSQTNRPLYKFDPIDRR
ncbi:hypothetical protein [Mesorhizobium sp.]|uniref:hypothetical protein n=1 Tax=Mesorhizobium sp. TaxID=1871066 RepID=UPI000FE94DAB|nr:MAG: IS6 family transposase [Mesorhizobium sp.]